MPEVRTRSHGGGTHAGGVDRELTATVVGGGLAGSEAAWALAERGVAVTLYEMRPVRTTAAHQTDRLAELVCSNSFKSVEPGNAHGLLKAEMRRLSSIVLDAADRARVPGGAALAVDRVAFSQAVHERVTTHPAITLVRAEVTELAAPAVVATGPLTSEALAAAIARRLDASSLAFFDAIAPIVSVESLDTALLFKASRYGKGGGDDYWNAPLTEEQYDAFVAALRSGEQYQPHHEFDKTPYFEGCLPVEEMAARGRDVLRFGPMKPVGLLDPRACARGRSPYAVVQLRQEDRAGQMWNLVGFQTRLKIAEQQRVFRMIPGLERAEFLRFGSIHRNAYINSPRALSAHLSAKDDLTLLFAGQLTGVEGYTESAATGILAGINLARLLHGEAPVVPPPTTMLGALYRYVHTADPAHFQPMNANFGLLEPLERPPRDKQKKRELLVERALGDMDAFARRVNAEVGTWNAEPQDDTRGAPRPSPAVPRSDFRVPR
ncbi:MAG TPA: methylenetetrahydrofolate--tRNA-(uracil(54)-C(5))-methyltransferase (FADH(2)-oxidizing) TrmFO [Gemmatimonadales bacterium]|nr:methylenetetrahydrofolate--tRNA-(uracil(54)-C(5))-methyltransferase (FADH(2)-oxidizing) TrmFO [Gemmatimonadales bacterium]